jgi:hypothetical protein
MCMQVGEYVQRSSSDCNLPKVASAFHAVCKSAMQVFAPTVLAMIRVLFNKLLVAGNRLHPTLTAILLDKAAEPQPPRWMILQTLDLMFRADDSLLLLLSCVALFSQFLISPWNPPASYLLLPRVVLGSLPQSKTATDPIIDDNPLGAHIPKA